MPKGRSTTSSSSGSSSGATISRGAGGAGAGGGGITGMGGGAGTGGGGGIMPAGAAGPVNETASRTMVIPSHSGSRGMENLTVWFTHPDQAEVTSGSGRTYEVNTGEGTCTCIDHRIRQRECRHIRAVNEASGRMSREAEASDGIMDVGREVDSLVSFDARELLEQQERPEDDGRYISEMGENEFSSLLREAAGEGLPYEYENVLNGSPATFGIELEHVGGNNDAIAAELKRLGLNGSGRVLGYTESHSRIPPEDRDKWRVTLDSSVGGEIVSPILTDTPETWRQLEKVCEVIRRHGGRISARCGGHVHVGVDVLDNSKHRWRRYKKLISGFENILYRLSTNRNLPTHRGTHYARPVGDSYRDLMDHTINVDQSGGTEALQALARRFNVFGHSSGVSTNNIADGSKPTIEFRTFNGSLDPAQVQNNVRVAVGIIQAAKNARTRSESTRKRGEMLKAHTYIQRPAPDDHSHIKKFLDIVFTRTKDKRACLGAYGRSQWQNI